MIWSCPPLPLPPRLTFVSMSHHHVNVPDSNQLPATAAGVRSNGRQRQSRLKSGSFDNQRNNRFCCYKCGFQRRMAHSKCSLLSSTRPLLKAPIVAGSKTIVWFRKARGYNTSVTFYSGEKEYSKR